MTAAQTFLIEPFDIMLHATEDGVHALQARFATWLCTLRQPARFLCWQMPATLAGKIAAVSAAAEAVDDGQRRRLLVEYRRYYESLDADAEYQRALCGMALWSDGTTPASARALAGSLASAFDTYAVPGPFPALSAASTCCATRPSGTWPHPDAPAGGRCGRC